MRSWPMLIKLAALHAPSMEPPAEIKLILTMSSIRRIMIGRLNAVVAFELDSNLYSTCEYRVKGTEVCCNTPKHTWFESGRVSRRGEGQPRGLTEQWPLLWSQHCWDAPGVELPVCQLQHGLYASQPSSVIDLSQRKEPCILVYLLTENISRKYHGKRCLSCRQKSRYAAANVYGAKNTICAIPTLEWPFTMIRNLGSWRTREV